MAPLTRVNLKKLSTVVTAEVEALGNPSAEGLGIPAGTAAENPCSCSNGVECRRRGLGDVFCLRCGVGTERYRRYVERLHGGLPRSGIPERLKRLHGRSLATRTISSEPGKADAYVAARQFVLSLTSEPNNAGHAGQGLLVLGPNGVGKSGLMVLIAQAIYQMGIGFLWTRWGSLLEDIRAQYGLTESGSRQLVAQRVPVLLLDDLGDPFRRRGDYQETENKRSILMDVLGYRHEMLKPTVMTANYASRGEMDEQLDPRITSRIFEMCHVVHMGGRDLRI